MGRSNAAMAEVAVARITVASLEEAIHKADRLIGKGNPKLVKRTVMGGVEAAVDEIMYDYYGSM
jgi:hypothetical protein